ncbi:MAG: cytochrome-c peroxidase [Pseudomonadota bacterium]|jgi:cytochrome c peroxidase
MGRYRTPSLRNVALTGPYLHDGTELTFERVVQLHLRGGRLVAVGPYPGDGRLSPLRDARLVPVALSTTELHELESFLLALTDPAFIANPRIGNPFRDPAPP